MNDNEKEIYCANCKFVLKDMLSSRAWCTVTERHPVYGSWYMADCLIKNAKRDCSQYMPKEIK